MVGSGWIGGALRRIESGGLMEEKRARAFLHEPKCYLFIFYVPYQIARNRGGSCTKFMPRPLKY